LRARSDRPPAAFSTSREAARHGFDRGARFALDGLGHVQRGLAPQFLHLFAVLFLSFAQAGAFEGVVLEHGQGSGTPPISPADPKRHFDGKIALGDPLHDGGDPHQRTDNAESQAEVPSTTTARTSPDTDQTTVTGCHRARRRWLPCPNSACWPSRPGRR